MRALIAGAVALLTLLVAVGCGGKGGANPGSASAARGGVTVTIVWPKAPRTIPNNTSKVTVRIVNSQNVTVKDADGNDAAYDFNYADGGVAASGTSTHTFSKLLPNTYGVAASAFNANSANPLASGTDTVLVRAGVAGEDTVPFAITMDATLGRLKIASDAGFGNSAFYVTDAGDLYGNSDGSGPISSLTFDASVTTSNVTVTPQSSYTDANGATQWSSLYLIPRGSSAGTVVNPVNPLVLTMGAGFGPLTNVSGADAEYTATLTNLKTVTASSMTIEYKEGGVHQKSFVVPFTLSTNSAAVTSSITLPTLYASSPALYNITAKLTEDGTGGLVYSGALQPSGTAGAYEIRFGTVLNRGRTFTASVSLQARTTGGGFVEIASGGFAPTGTPPLPSLAYGDLASSSISLAYKAVDLSGQDELTFKRGTATTLAGVKAKFGGSTTSVILDPALFTCPATVTGLTVDRATNPSAWKVSASDTTLSNNTATANILLTFAGDPSASTTPASPFVKANITANGGLVGVGVN